MCVVVGKVGRGDACVRLGVAAWRGANKAGAARNPAMLQVEALTGKPSFKLCMTASWCACPLARRGVR